MSKKTVKIVKAVTGEVIPVPAPEAAPAPEATPAAETRQIVTQQVSLTPTGRPSVIGTRVCNTCGVSEADTLKKNPKYSLCKGMCVFCYNKKRNKSTKSVEELQAELVRIQNEIATRTAQVPATVTA